MAEPQTCAVHPDRAATYRCDGCHRALCDDCVQMSHRLILCVVCGEMAIPLATGRATSSRAVRKTRAMEGPYSLLDALLYPLRGHGSGVFWGYVALLVIFSALGTVPVIGCFIAVPILIVGLMVPRLLFTIVRATADGDNELPEWPELDFWERLVDALAFGVMWVISWLPAVALVFFSGCGARLVQEGGWGAAGPSCWIPVVVGVLLSKALWIATFGAPAVFDSFWLLPRVDLHVRALFVAPGEAAVIALFLGGLSLLSFGLGRGFDLVPVVGAVTGTALSVYTTFTGAHLVGLYFRRNAERLERLYLH